MYNIASKTIEDLVITNFGETKWTAVKERSGMDLGFFRTDKRCDELSTKKLAAAVSDETHLPMTEVLQTFGQWWVLHTGREKYLKKAGGKELKEFLVNLPLLHNRIMMMYSPKIQHEFVVSDLHDRRIMVHYFSKALGLQEYIRGLLLGIGKLYNTEVDVELLSSKDAGDDHEIFIVSW